VLFICPHYCRFLQSFKNAKFFPEVFSKIVSLTGPQSIWVNRDYYRAKVANIVEHTLDYVKARRSLSPQGRNEWLKALTTFKERKKCFLLDYDWNFMDTQYIQVQNKVCSPPVLKGFKHEKRPMKVFYDESVDSLKYDLPQVRMYRGRAFISIYPQP